MRGLERRFQDEYFDTNLQCIRIATVLGAVTWAAFGPLAQLVVQEGLARDALIRYGLGVPTGLVMALAIREEISQVRWPSGDLMHVRIGMATGPAVA
jgi:class 3 adenylate cyclase